jgi:hypothetical protein
MVRLKSSVSVRKQKMGVLFNRNNFGGSRFALFAVFCCGLGGGLLLVAKNAFGEVGIAFGVAGLVCLALASS